ncbi:MAG: hypothetical protein GX986_06635 [Firmicutes bacterium]|nr:hypothetical protein [Bacillota bacterium]
MFRKHLTKSVLFVVLAMVMAMSVSVFAEEIVASINIPLSTYFARVQVNPTYQLLNRASVAFGEAETVGTEFEGLPVLSRMSVARGGFKGADDFLDRPAGDLTHEDIAYLYRYSNTVQALKLNGKQIVEWLEASAGNFNQIDPDETEDQLLINYGFDGHHLDHFWGITYMYDITKPLGQRVVMAEYEGTPLSEDMEFIIMTDNFRAGGGGGLPNAVPENIVMKWDHDFDIILIDYLNKIDGIAPELVHNWSIKPIETKGRILVQTGPEWGIPAMEYVEVASELGIEPVDHITYFGSEDVWGLFEIDLSKVQTP